MAKNIELEGFDEFVRALAEAPGLARPIMGKKMKESLFSLRGTLKETPPQPPRDRAKTFNTYVRGFGHRPKSYFTGGSRRIKGVKSLAKQTSEKLDTKWTDEIEFEAEAVIGVLGNTASYAQVVQGELQPDFHAQTGWITLDDALDQHEAEINDNFEAGVDELLAALGRR